jgi:sterol desaturase/sphingolipid hydroxylase (fatty acid hydroxylase superfamily)
MFAPLVQAFESIQGALFMHIVQPVFFRMGWMGGVDEAFEWTGIVLLGLLEIALLMGILGTWERLKPFEAGVRMAGRSEVNTDVLYTWLNRLGFLPLLIFFALLPLEGMVDEWLHGQGIVKPQLEHVLPGLPPLASFLIYLLVLDFVEYWMHRGQHAFRWWWALHSLHHSQRHMTFWTDDRNHLLDDILLAVVQVLVAKLIGVPPAQFVMLVIAARAIESLSHANVRASFGWLGERLIVSPRFHRIHHAIGVGHEGKYQGVNFATLFPMWDMLFGTADFRANLEPTGIADQLQGRNYGQGWWQQQWLGLRRMVDARA